MTHPVHPANLPPPCRLAILAATALALLSAVPTSAEDASEPWLKDRLEWFQDLKFGFMMHWAPYSQWGCIESWPLVEVDKWGRPDDLPAWTERDKDMERFKRDYWALPKTFNPAKFAPRKWAGVAKAAGMKYVVFTTKHHDGFSMFDTRLTDYRITAPDVPFHANAHSNVVRKVFDAFRKERFAIGAYFSKADWHSPDYWSPDAPARDRNPNYDTLKQPDKWRKFVEFTHGQIEELLTGYGPIDILWLNAGQVRPPQQDLQMDRLAAMARRHQPRLIVVDRTVGGRYENYRTPEQEVPDQPLPYVWETCMTMGDQWSFKPNDKYKSPHQPVYLPPTETEGLPRELSFAGLKPAPGAKIQLLGIRKPLKWRTGDDRRTIIELPEAAIQSPPCRHAFVFRFDAGTLPQPQ